MRFQLFELIAQRGGQELRGHIVAPSWDAAWLTFIDHEEALGLPQSDFTLERVDEKLGEHHRRGLDELLESAPVGFASFAGRWIAHTAPVQQLKLYRTADDEGGNLFAIAPNVDIAASVFTSALGILPGEVRMLHIADGMADMPDSMVCNLPRLLEFGPIAIVEFSAEHGWTVR